MIFNYTVTSMIQKEDLFYFNVINLVKRKGKSVSLPIHNVFFNKSHKAMTG